MTAVFMDLEMKPVEKKYRPQWTKCHNEVIEFGAVKIADGREVDSYCCVVKPAFGEIPAYFEDLTGVTNTMTAGSPDFETALQGFIDFCADAETVYAWSESDLAQIKGEVRQKGLTISLASLIEKWADYQRYFTDSLHLEKVVSLDKAMDMALLPFDGHQHDALWDARNTAKLYLAQDDLEVSTRLRKAAARQDKVQTTYSLAGAFSKCLGLFGDGTAAVGA